MELSLTKLFGGSRYLIQSIHAKKLQVRIFSRLGLKIQDNALTRNLDIDSLNRSETSETENITF